MKFAKTLLLLGCSQILLLSAGMNAQQAATSSTAAVVPQLVSFSGKATDAQGKPIAGIAGITFAIYQDQGPWWVPESAIYKTLTRLRWGRGHCG